MDKLAIQGKVIREAGYLKCIANVVLVEEVNGKRPVCKEYPKRNAVVQKTPSHFLVINQD